MRTAFAQAHVIAASAAILLGLFVFLNRKGTCRHVRIGIGYVVSMVVMNLTALGLYRLTGQFNAFHVAALMSMATVVAGMVPAVRRQPRDRWLRYHFEFMSWSYVGLIAGAVSEAATRLPQAPFWGARRGGECGHICPGQFPDRPRPKHIFRDR